MKKSLVIKRSIVIAGHKTSVAVEDAFWNALHGIARERHETLSHLVSSIDADRKHSNLSSAIRLYVLEFYRDALDHPSRKTRLAISHSTISRH
jgi:predicted DNA-binding ribbon-helix-helix protein